jgi:hypothetical protein
MGDLVYCELAEHSPRPHSIAQQLHHRLFGDRFDGLGGASANGNNRNTAHRRHLCMTSLTATFNAEATTIEEVARELAVAIATALDAMAPFWSAPRRRFGINLMLVRPPGPMLAMQILPTFALDIATAGERERFRDAIVEALKRHCSVRSFSTVRELIAAARAPAPQREARPLLHSARSVGGPSQRRRDLMTKARGRTKTGLGPAVGRVPTQDKR